MLSGLPMMLILGEHTSDLILGWTENEMSNEGGNSAALHPSPPHGTSTNPPAGVLTSHGRRLRPERITGPSTQQERRRPYIVERSAAHVDWGLSIGCSRCDTLRCSQWKQGIVCCQMDRRRGRNKGWSWPMCRTWMGTCTMWGHL